MIDFIDGKRIVGQPEHSYATVTIPMTGVETEVAAITFKSNGRQCYLIFVGNASGVGGEAFLTWRILINGIPQPPYDSNLNQWADPARVGTDTLMMVKIPCESGDKVQAMAKNSDGTTDYSGTARLLGVYTSL